VIRSGLFRKHLAIAAVSVLGFAFAGSLLNQLVVHQVISRMERESGERIRRPDPATFLARLIDVTSPNDPVAGMKKIEKLFGATSAPFRLALLNEELGVLYEIRDPNVPAIDRAKLPGADYETADADAHAGTRSGPLPTSGFIRLGSGRPFFLYYELIRPNFMNRGKGAATPPPPPLLGDFGKPLFRAGPHGPSRNFLFFSFFVSVAMVLAGIAFALFLIFRSLRDHVATADRVISELQGGDLKARFPVRKRDEIGQAMERFNLMAEEIEKLVERLRSSEQSRNFLLQDLTHDLRTPVASLRNLLDTIFTTAKMPESLQELSDLAVKEVDYISRLVEDLLLLAQVSEPKYKAPEHPVEMMGLLEEEANSLSLRYAGKVKLQAELKPHEALVSGDERLMKRLVRNALENAFSFAKGEVEIRAEREAHQLRLLILDDGPGFSAEALAHFGERRAQRTINQSPQGRLSLGLGSVIMKTVVGLHRGRITAANRPGGGGEVEIVLPLSH
jgi:signal transduction histidine kinase